MEGLAFGCKGPPQVQSQGSFGLGQGFSFSSESLKKLFPTHQPPDQAQASYLEPLRSPLQAFCVLEERRIFP